MTRTEQMRRPNTRAEITDLAEQQGWTLREEMFSNQACWTRKHRQLIVRFAHRGGVTAAWFVDPHRGTICSYSGARTAGKKQLIRDWLEQPPE